MERRLCPECGGEIKEDSTDLEYVLDNIKVRVNNVPADVCPTCGQSFLRSHVALEVNRLVNRIAEDIGSFLKVEPTVKRRVEREITLTI